MTMVARLALAGRVTAAMVSLAKRTPRRMRAARLPKFPVDTFDISRDERFRNENNHHA